MNHDPAHHDRREREQRGLAANAPNKTARDFHGQTADRHAAKASGIREDAEVAARAVYDRLIDEAAAENDRIAAAAAERETRHPTKE